MSEPTMQQALRATLDELMAKDSRVFIIGEDVGVLGGAFGITAGLLERYGPERVRDAPISETAILGAAIGAALLGQRPVCEMQFVDFMFVALDQLLHQAAPAHYASGGANTVPLVVPANYGVGPGAGPQDSGTLYGALLQFPGLTVVIPSGSADAADLLRQAVEDLNPVLFLEPRELYRVGDMVADLPPLPLRKARILRQGKHLTCTAVGGMVRKALTAAQKLAAEGIEAEIIDLRCVAPLDECTILDSAVRTGCLLALDEGPRGGGLAAEVIAVVAESEIARVRRVATRRLTAARAPVALCAASCARSRARCRHRRRRDARARKCAARMKRVPFLDAAALTRANVSPIEAMAAIELGLAALGRNAAQQPHPFSLSPGGGAFFQPLAAALPEANVACVNWLTFHPANSAAGRPHSGGVLILNEFSTGEPLCLMDGIWISHRRTGFIAGLGARYLGGGSGDVALIGPGAIAACARRARRPGPAPRPASGLRAPGGKHARLLRRNLRAARDSRHALHGRADGRGRRASDRHVDLA